LGEYAAACLAGVIPLDDALELVAARGRLGATLPPDGAMAAVSAPVAQVQAELARDTAGATGAVTIAAFNGPEHVVLSGRRDAVEAIARRLEAAGFRTRLLRVAFAAHSPHVDAIVPAFGEALASVAFGRPRVTLVSNLTGRVAEP